MSKRRMIAVLAAGLICCGFVQAVAAKETSDPFEGMNRKILAFNDAADRWLLKPIAKGYVKITPRLVRTGISNFFINLGYPLVVVNQFLQGKFHDGMSDAGRFIMNTTLGIGGLFDPASGANLPLHEEDFGQTFGRWGAGSGPFLVIPFLGPSTVRDGTGAVVSFALQPMRFVIDDDNTRYGLTALNFVQIRASLLDVEKLISGDRYIFLRDAFLQRRQYLIQDGRVTDEFMDEDWEK